VRRWLFGPIGVGQVLYLVLEREQEVHLLQVMWLELPED
jgi:vacuolar-type H+-ATPase subunit C/Vma6